MPGPASTGNILVLFGHGAPTDATFDFRRAQTARVNLYSWSRDGVPVWDRQIQLAANDALASGTIRNSYATVNSSRIGGTLMRDYVLSAPDGLNLPTIPAGYRTTSLSALGATVHHNAATLGASTLMLLLVDAGQSPVALSDVLNDAAFNARPLDVLWCACKSSP